MRVNARVVLFAHPRSSVTMRDMDWNGAILFVMSCLVAWLLRRPWAAYYFDPGTRMILTMIAIFMAVLGLLAFIGLAEVKWQSDGALPSE